MSKKRYRPEEIIAKLWGTDDRMEEEVGRRLCCHISADLRGERLNKMQTPRKQRPFERRRAVNTRPQRPDGAKPYLNSDPDNCHSL